MYELKEVKQAEAAAMHESEFAGYMPDLEKLNDELLPDLHK